MLVNDNVKMALGSLRSARWRSFLTMLGIIIGVVSVVTIVSLGEGVKRQVNAHINRLGNDLITIRPGHAIKRDSGDGLGPLRGLTASASLNGELSEGDISTIKATPGVVTTVPLATVSGIATVENRQLLNGVIIATNENLPQALKQKVLFGQFFTPGDANKHVVVIGKSVAEELFRENVPLGRTLTIRGQEFIVRGVFDQFESNPLSPESDYNYGIFMPLPVSRGVATTRPPIFQILARSKTSDQASGVAQDITKRLMVTHAGQQDFTVLKAQENQVATTALLNLITQMISGVAAISLLVGGIGIMNIMLVSVTERTHEIGIRKAIGATNKQILSQFLIEAVVLSFVGGLFGVLLSLLSNVLLRIFTDLKPVLTIPIMLIATGVALVVGVIFGLTPAVRAARKDPIDALRHE